jgi:hypothetical protein
MQKCGTARIGLQLQAAQVYMISLMQHLLQVDQQELVVRVSLKHEMDLLAQE